MAFRRMAFRRMTFRRMTFRRMTFRRMTFRRMTLSITSLERRDCLIYSSNLTVCRLFYFMSYVNVVLRSGSRLNVVAPQPGGPMLFNFILCNSYI
jgi:hypothetical protein